jgi:hypothetical protein
MLMALVEVRATFVPNPERATVSPPPTDFNDLNSDDSETVHSLEAMEDARFLFSGAVAKPALIRLAESDIGKE